MTKEVFTEKTGYKVSDELFEKCLSLARKKLQRIIRQFGDENGVRRTPDYLAELVAEAVKSELLTEYSITISSLHM